MSPTAGEVAARQAASEALLNAYAPYSGFAVGASLLCDDGRVFSGCNVENASYPAGICAERSALACAVTQGARGFSLLVVCTKADQPTPPCGICRQAIAEFAPSLDVLSVTQRGDEARWSMATLLTQPFTPALLRQG
jgi:cytidine deaminase